jgi:FtsH-binding integral membrane protein
MKIQGRHYFSLFWVLFFAGFIYISFGYTYKARLIPLVVCIPCLIFALYRFYVEFTGREAQKGMTTEDLLLQGNKNLVGGASEGYKHEDKQTLHKAEKRRRFLDILLWIGILLVLVFAAGFLIAIPVFTLAYMRVKKESWLLSTLSSIGLTVGVYLAFVIGTESYLYEGLLLPLIRQALQS